MEILLLVYLFIFWTLFWSFSSVIIERIKNKKAGIISGRSECPNCKHKLWVLDLIPIFSFLSTKGKCRYCQKKISFLYPLLEICSGILFVLVGYFLIDFSLLISGNLVEIYKLWFFLLFSFLTIVYVFYDILYLEIPESILLILISLTFFTITLQTLIPNFHIIEILPAFSQNFSYGESMSLLILGILMIGSFYFIMLKWLKEIYDIAIVWFFLIVFLVIKFFLFIDLEQSVIGSALLGSFLVFLFLFIQIVISWGSWMWGGDLRIAILMWLLAWWSFSFYAILVSYFIGSVIGIWILIYTKTRNYYIEQKNYLSKVRKVLWLKPKKVSLDTKMPFGPFLAIGIYGILFFSEAIKDIFHYL